MKNFRQETRYKDSDDFKPYERRNHCGQLANGFICTRIKGHSDKIHAAHISDASQVATWEDGRDKVWGPATSYMMPPPLTDGPEAPDPEPLPNDRPIRHVSKYIVPVPTAYDF